MTVWVVHRDVAYECGYVVAICASEEIARRERQKDMEKNSVYRPADPEEWSIQECEVEE